MARNAENFAPNVVILDDSHAADGVLNVFVVGEAFPRLQVHLDGTILAGDGTEAPANAQAAVNADFESRIAALEV